MMFSRIAAVGAISAGMTLNLNRRKAYCSPPPPATYAFDTRGLPKVFPHVENGKMWQVAENEVHSHPVYLVGCGMRRKWLFVADFDVYMVGVGLSQGALRQAVPWANSPPETRKPLSAFVLPEDRVNGEKSVKAAIMIRMVRGTTVQQFVDAFREAFVGVSDANFKEFSPLLESCMGSKGMAAKDEMVFLILNDNTMILAKNNEVKGSLKNDEITYRMFDIYSDPKRAVSKELADSLAQNVLTIQKQYAP